MFIFHKLYLKVIQKGIQQANQALVDQIKNKYPDLYPDLTADNVVSTIGSDNVNAWQHGYIAGKIAIEQFGLLAIFLGHLKEIITMFHGDDRDSIRDLYNNDRGVELAQKSKSLEDFAEQLFEKQFTMNNNEVIPNGDNPFLIVDCENDNRIDEEINKMIDNFYNSRDTDMPEDMINDLYDQYNGYRGKFRSAGDCECTPKDPIIFDLNNDGVLETTDINNGVYFDHENDGFAESSAWVGDNDGVLVTDSNNNGEIDNGSELLTAETLASFDTNEDGIIDENDTNFANLKILKGDGTLMTLAEAGITSINLNTTSTEITDKNGNQQFASGTFTRADGTTGKFGEFLVKTETSNSIATEWLEETDEISDLPDISGSGNIYSLHQAMRHVA